ncbi:MAG: hypothetical protein U1E65_34900 [Myxococcota bacterium]
MRKVSFAASDLSIQTPEASAPYKVSKPKGKALAVIEGGPSPKPVLVSRHTTSTTAGRHTGAVSAALLGLQGVSMLVGAPAAHAAVTPSEEALRLARSDTSRMSAEDLAAARRALWTAYASSIGAPQTAAELPFEAAWKAAASGSIDRAGVVSALGQIPQKTDAGLSGLLSTYQDKLSADGKRELQSAIAGTLIDGAASDGKVTTDELKTISADLTKRFGDDEGRRALLRAFPRQIDKLDSTAATYLLEQAGALDLHVARFQTIVDELLAGQNKLVDTNGDGKVDAGDVVFTKTDAGVTVAKVTQAVADQARVSKGMIDAAEKMHGAGISFQLIKNHKANPDFWTVESYSGTLTLKPGVKPSDALNDMIAHGDKYGFECATGLVATYYQAMLDILGPKDFDRIATDLRIGPWDMEDDLSRLMIETHPDGGYNSEVSLKDQGKLLPGGYYYFRNWDVTDEARARGWQGENVIYLGEGKFYGHGIGMGPGSDFVTKLKNESKPDGKTPSLLNLHRYLSTDVLKLDLDPNN